MNKRNIQFFVLPVGILIASISIALALILNPGEAKKRPKVPSRTVSVSVHTVSYGDYPVYIEAMGQVIPAMQVDLKSRVSGEVIKVAKEFLPGGFVEKGEPIVYLDPKDYQLALKKQRAMLQQAQANLKLELGRQESAKNELALLAKSTGTTLDNPELALRQPQLEHAQAELEKAQSDVAIAQLNLERTIVRAPFNALITQRDVTVGHRVSVQDKLASLVNTDTYWIQIALPVQKLQWLVLPSKKGQSGSQANLILQDDQTHRTGQLLKVTGTVDSRSRFADVLVEVRDPLLLQERKRQSQYPLIVGDYVKVVLKGKLLTDIFRIPLSWLRDENTLWVVRDARMYFQPVAIIYKDKDYAYVEDGLAVGDQVVSSDVPVATDGMEVEVSQIDPLAGS